jgi:3-phenylpropionate/trans-cinnamate dioxygenase ferredoxin reductase subunit
VRVLEGTSLAGIEGRDGHLAAAVLADGTRLPADLAVVGIGVTPNTAIAEEAGLPLDNGIAVDAACRTADPAIVAAGDVASFPWRGRRIRLESVQNAIDMGRAAARSLLGQPVTYDPVPWFWSDQFDVKLQIAGLNLGHDRVVTRPGPRPGTASTWYFAGPHLLAVDAMGDARAYMTAKRWIEAGHSPDLARLADPAADLKALG